MEKLKYYFMSWNHSAARGIVAYSDLSFPDSMKFLDDSQNDSLDGPTFMVKDVLETKTGLVVESPDSDREYKWLDYLPNDLAWPLMSEKMKKIVDYTLTPGQVTWLESKVTLLGEQRTYYTLKFIKSFDVLDVNKTLYTTGGKNVIRPFFSRDKIRDLSIFSIHREYNLWKITSSIYISTSLRSNLKSSKCSGIQFDEVLSG